MKKEAAIHLAAALKEKLLQQGIPLQKVFLFGSTAKEQAGEQSDVDIAVICTPFRKTRLEENVVVSRAREGIDLRIETICLHPEDMENKYSMIAQEVKRHGIPV